MSLKVVYLASPYSHKDPAVMQQRFEEVSRIHGELLVRYGDEYAFIGPITQSHNVALFTELPSSWEFWKAQDEALLSRCDEMWVIPLDGWRESVGVRAEIDFAKDNNIKVGIFIDSCVVDYDSIFNEFYKDYFKCLTQKMK